MTKTDSKYVQNLEEDHREIQNLLRQFEEADDQSRERIANDLLTKLEIHSNLEEDLIYPAFRAAIGNDDMIDKALEEHHVFTLLGRELRTMHLKDERYVAKFKVLSDVVLHHIQEEERHIFPEAKKVVIDFSSERRVNM
jgi:hypothetical protein